MMNLGRDIFYTFETSSCVAARDLMLAQHSLDMFGFEYVEYYQIVRDLIEEYRLLFIDWWAGFDKWDYIIDRWGLFNPSVLD